MSSWDRRGTGSREFTPEEYERVVSTLRDFHVGHANRVRTEDLGTETGVGGRTLRGIFAEADGREFVLGQGDDGVFVAETAEDAEPGTRRLEAQARKMLARANRRRDFDLPKVQGTLL